MIKAYVHRELGYKQVFPVPENMTDWVEVEVSSMEELHSTTLDGDKLVPDPAIPAEQVRNERDSLLAEADTLVYKAQDSGDAEAEALARAYRQALRDVPEQEGFPYEVVWPTKPT